MSKVIAEKQQCLWVRTHGFNDLKYTFGFNLLLSLAKIPKILPSHLNEFISVSCKEIEHIITYNGFPGSLGQCRIL